MILLLGWSCRIEDVAKDWRNTDGGGGENESYMFVLNPYEDFLTGIEIVQVGRKQSLFSWHLRL
jgi:hypothetical protein